MQQTIAEDCGDHYRLNGSKIFISGGGIADVYVIMAMTDQSKGTKGISAFIVEKGWEGYQIAPVAREIFDAYFFTQGDAASDGSGYGTLAP